ncbi:MAG: tetratricopeptide repeat protein, partial [Deltaproteobacteria bacterium]
CHADKDAQWADKLVREWRPRDYQAPLLKRAALIDSARKRDGSKLPEMLTYIQSRDRDEVFAASLIRLLMATEDPRITPVLLAAMKDSSPLVRAAGAEALGLRKTQETLQALVEAAGDDYRLVRVRAAASLGDYPGILSAGKYGEQLKKAGEELLASLSSRPDQWTSHYNMGNYHLVRGQLKEAAASYETALKLEPGAVMATVNASFAHARMGQNDKAEQFLKKALKTSPESAAANFNMGLLKAEQKDMKAAERHLKKALKNDPLMAQAAFNLCVMLSKDRLSEAIGFCRKASDLRPENPQYAYTLAFYLHQEGRTDEAISTLKATLEKHPEYRDAQMFLRKISRKE